MVEKQLDEKALEEYRTAWVEANYIVCGWWIEPTKEEEWRLNS